MSALLRTLSRRSAPIALAVGAAFLWGCPSKTPPPAPEAVDAEAQQEARVPSCDASTLDNVASTLASNKAGWSAARGVLPAFSDYAASMLWKHCDLPPGYRLLLASLVRVPPEATALIEKAMPGYGAIQEDAAATQGLVELESTACEGRSTLAGELAALPAQQRSAATFDRCELPSTPLNRDAFIKNNLGFDGVATIALHGWLLKAGVVPDTADALIQTLALERLPAVGAQVFAPPPTLRLPPVESTAQARASALVYATTQSVTVQGKEVLKLDAKTNARTLLAGSGLQALVDAMPTSNLHGVTFAIDRDVSWDVAGLLMASATRAGATWVDALVLGSDPSDALRRVTMLQHFEGDAAMTVTLEGESVTARCGDVREATLEAAIQTCSLADGVDGAPVEVRIGRTTSFVQVLGLLTQLGERPRKLMTTMG